MPDMVSVLTDIMGLTKNHNAGCGSYSCYVAIQKMFQDRLCFGFHIKGPIRMGVLPGMQFKHCFRPCRAMEQGRSKMYPMSELVQAPGADSLPSDPLQGSRQFEGL